MADLKKDAIVATDLTEYLATFSEFDFEMRVVEKFKANNWTVQHSASYVDPVTGKNRQFDIRATKTLYNQYRFFLAVECKNLQPYYPLVVHSLLRTRAEAYHEVVKGIGMQASVHRIKIPNSGLYSVGPTDWAGKETDQLGRDTNGKLKTGDEKVYEKMSQAGASARDLIEQSLSGPGANVLTVIIPILVIPDNTLWEIRYDRPGLNNTMQSPGVAIYRPQTWDVGSGIIRASYTMSHLEVLTFSEVSRRIVEITSQDWLDYIFPTPQLSGN